MQEKATPPTARELDAQLAQRLFGWQWWLIPERGGKAGLWPPGEEPCFPKAERLESPGDRPRFRDWDRDVPRYSSRIEDAWAVVGAMRGRGYHLRLESLEDCWVADFDSDEKDGHGTVGSSAPEAISRAAFAALEGKP